MEKVRFFRRSLLGTECDACGGRVDLMQGGACASCRRILCFRHLYGSWLVRYAEIYPGANALEYGASSFGGAINFVTPTGITSEGYRLRSELGGETRCVECRAGRTPEAP